MTEHSNIVERLRAVDHMSVEDCFLQSGLYGQAAAEIDRLRIELDEQHERRFQVEHALHQCQKVLADLIDPENEVNTTAIVIAWARCVEAEVKARTVLKELGQ